MEEKEKPRINFRTSSWLS